MPQDGRIAPMPAGLAFDQAAALCFGGTTALHFQGRKRGSVIVTLLR